MAVLIDTSVFVDAERGRLRLRDVLVDGEDYGMSVITAGELLHGVYRAVGERALRRQTFVEGLMSRFRPVGMGIAVGRTYALMSAEVAKGGHTVNANDLWIAATAVSRGFAVMTVGGDFDRIPGVRVVAP